MQAATGFAQPPESSSNPNSAQQISYPYGYPSNPSSYPPSWVPQQQHPGYPPAQQNGHPRGGGYNNYNRYPDPGFHNQYPLYNYYPNHPYPPMGGPGPGPATMQNGYGYHHPPPPPPVDVNDDSTSTSFTSNEPQFASVSYPSLANGQSQPPYQPFYPPNHPYAYGVGYPPPGHGYGYNDSYPLQMNGNGPINGGINGSGGKGLNPAAQGYVPAPRRNGDNGVNGHTFAPVVDGEKLKGLGSGLGLTQLDQGTPAMAIPIPPTPMTLPPAPPPPPPLDPVPSIPVTPPVEITSTTPVTVLPNHISSDVSATPSKASESSIPAVDATPSPIVTPSQATSQSSVPDATPLAPLSIVQTPVASTSVSSALSPPTTPASPGLTFLGATLNGFTSPPPSTKPARSPVNGTAKRRSKLKVSASRPPVEDIKDNSYFSGLHIPNSVSTELVGESLTFTKTPKQSTRTEPSNKRSVYVSGDSPHTGGLTFGTIQPQSEPPTNLLEPSEAVVIFEPTQPAIKPSWAALLKTSKPFSRTQSTPEGILSPSPKPSLVGESTKPSPAKSTISLPDDVTSPPPAPASLLEVKPAPRPISFAAAAAAAAGLPPPTPQEELTRLLSEGVRRPRESAPVGIARGLINTGNMCFANTILQVLVYCPPFTELFEELGKRLKADLARRTPLLEAMIIFLRECSGDAEGAFIPENVYDAMKENKRFDSMRRGHQEDAEEYLGFFLDTLHEEMLSIATRKFSTRPITNGDDWLEVGKKQKTNVVRVTSTSKSSAISSLFGGTLRSVLHTPGSKDSITLEPYQPLQLDITHPQVVTITDALRHLGEPETVPGVWSPSKGANVDATKQIYLETFPPVLILHLKRFVYDQGQGNVVKRGRPVGYGMELVIPPEIISPGRRGAVIKYRLFGVVYHHGTSASGGHYTVSVARQDGKGWIHFDDETTGPIPIEEVVVSKEEAEIGRAGLIGGREKCAYLLFYQRVRV